MEGVFSKKWFTIQIEDKTRENIKHIFYSIWYILIKSIEQPAEICLKSELKIQDGGHFFTRAADSILKIYLVPRYYQYALDLYGVGKFHHLSIPIYRWLETIIQKKLSPKNFKGGYILLAFS